MTDGVRPLITIRTDDGWGVLVRPYPSVTVQKTDFGPRKWRVEEGQSEVLREFHKYVGCVPRSGLEEIFLW